MADPVKRLHYFDHQFLRATDFTDEQDYHIRMRRLHNQLLHVWGVAKGLDLAAPAGSTRVTVREGAAIDGLGRELVLPTETQTVDLSGFVSKSVFITLRYDERESDPTSETGAEGTTRSIEVPVIEVSLTPPADESRQLILGQAVVGADGKIASTNAGTDANHKRWAGVVGGDLSVSSLTIGDPSISTDRWAHVRLGAPNRVDFDSGLRLTGNLGVGTPPSDVSGDFGGALGRMRVRQGSAGTAGLWLSQAAKADRAFVGMANDDHVGLWGTPVGWGLIMNSDTGNVGIGLGATASDHRFHVKANGAVGLLESTSNNASLRLSTSDGFAKHVEIGNRPGGSLALWVNGADRLTIAQTGNVGIAVAPADMPFDVGDRMRLRAGSQGSAGLWLHQGAAAPDRAFIGMLNNDQVGLFGSQGANWGLVMHATSANVGIGIGGTSQFALDVGGSGRMRVRQGPNGTAGIWMFQNSGGDRGFVGMASDTQIGFWGNNGTNWGLVVDTATARVGINTLNAQRPLHVEGSEVHSGGGGGGFSFTDRGGAFVEDGTGGKRWVWYSLGGIARLWAGRDLLMINSAGVVTFFGPKVGYVVDQFVNTLDETLEEGDVVIVGANQTSLHYGHEDGIPIPEVDLTSKAMDTRVCGIVCSVHGTVETAEDGSPGKTSKHFTGEELAAVDAKKVPKGQVGYMVTLGSYAHCKVDADIAPVEVGDLLATSPTKGHAQKAAPGAKGVGAILGKALGSLASGKGKIPILVTLH